MAGRSSHREEFRFGLGHPVLEFVATLAGRRREQHERLHEPDDLARWLERAGLAQRTTCDEDTLAEARALREAIYRLLETARSRRRSESGDVELLNRWARRPAAAPQLDTDLGLSWTSTDPARAALAALAANAVELLSGPDLARVRHCASPSCSLLFIDHSRPGRRRWCSMDRCGNRDKTARYRRRRKAASADGPARRGLS
jgi:predicted RNA-binding Zn ribbon-like protein